jgi:hypothetical protein
MLHALTFPAFSSANNSPSLITTLCDI